jgi:hypothetical protein
MTEPEPACPVCARPNPDRTWAVCAHDAQAVDQWLREILDLHALVRCSPLTYLLPGTTGDSAPIGAHRDPPLPLDLAALDLLTGESILRGMDADDMGLEDWAVDWRHWLGHSGHGMATEHDRTAAQTLSGVIRYLRANWPLMARSAAAGGHPAVDEFHADVRAIRARAWAALRLIPSDLDHDLDPPADYTLPCPGCGLRIEMRRAPRDTPPGETAQVNCGRCGWHGTGEWLIRVAIASGARPEMTLRQVMDIHGVTERTVRRWVADGRLELRRGLYRTRHAEDEVVANVGHVT